MGMRPRFLRLIGPLWESTHASGDGGRTLAGDERKAPFRSREPSVELFVSRFATRRGTLARARHRDCRIVR
eukprot:5694999-Pyramimonas_sp.AAC.1